MVSEPGKAVFISYASQDADAARRVCEALRTAGVEVWFDQNELRGGDAWDQKIRQQIKDCALFVPVISANTQARPEGYFRLEWRLADQRTHLMGRAKPFVVPVCIDETRNSEADVPDSFLAVQWTRLPGGETPPSFCARVQQMLGADTPVGAALRRDGSQELVSAKSRRKAAPTKKPWRGLAAGILVVTTIAILAAVLVRRPKEERPMESSQPARISPATAMPRSEARQLVAKAWELLNKQEMARAELDAADALCKRAGSLDATDPEVWAAWSSVSTWYVFHRFDASDARREKARSHATMAMQLDANSFEARLAQALYWVRGEPNGIAPPKMEAAERLLRGLLIERPDEPRVLYTLGYLLKMKPSPKEGFELMERLAQNPRFTALAWNELGWDNMLRGRFEAAEIAADRSLAAQPYWSNLTLKALLATDWRGDLDLAKATLDRLPPAALQEDLGAGLFVFVHEWRRERQEIIRFLDALPSEWLSSNFLVGPKSFLRAEARRMVGQLAAARGDYRRAIELIDVRLAQEPNDANLLSLKAQALAHLGERPEAEEVYAQWRELNAEPSYDVLMVFESAETVIDHLTRLLERDDSWFTAAGLKLAPLFDPIRSHPRFVELVARAENDPRRSPHAKAAATGPK